MRADIALEESEYRGKRSSRAAIFGEEEEDDEDGEGFPMGEEEEEEEEDSGDDEDEDEDGENEDEDEEGEDGGPEEEDFGEDDELGFDQKKGRKKIMAGDLGSSRELEQLEEEYGMMNQEQEVLQAMKQRGEKERAKGKAVANQTVSTPQTPQPPRGKALSSFVHRGRTRTSFLDPLPLIVPYPSPLLPSTRPSTTAPSSSGSCSKRHCRALSACPCSPSPRPLRRQSLEPLRPAGSDRPPPPLQRKGSWRSCQGG
jgi:hypothetical protein